MEALDQNELRTKNVKIFDILDIDAKSFDSFNLLNSRKQCYNSYQKRFLLFLFSQSVQKGFGTQGNNYTFESFERFETRCKMLNYLGQFSMNAPIR